MSDRKTVFVLGAPDPESMFLFRTLRACGFVAVWATCGGASVTTRTAYEADGRGMDGARAVWIECRPAGCSRAQLEAIRDVVVDHHNPGDKGYGRSEEEAFEASSVGQVAYLAGTMEREASLTFAEAAKWSRLRGSLTTPDAVAIGAADHCLPAALAGRCADPVAQYSAEGEWLAGGVYTGGIMVDPERALQNHAESWEDAELAALLGRSPVPAATVLAGIARDRAALASAPRFALGGLPVYDLTGLPGGTLQYAPAAASLERGAYLAINPSRTGVPPTVSIGGATTPACVEAFMAAARKAVAAHRFALFMDVWTGTAAGDEVIEPDGTRGIIVGSRGLGAEFEVMVRANDRDSWWAAGQLTPAEPKYDASVKALAAFESACAAARKGEGVYGDPARGFAGTYAPVECVREALKAQA